MKKKKKGLYSGSTTYPVGNEKTRMNRYILSNFLPSRAGCVASCLAVAARAAENVLPSASVRALR